jgi:hypothetical protein
MKLEYKAETEDDIADLAECALSIRALASQGKIAQKADTGDEFYHDKIQTFTLIETFLEPILTFLTDDAPDIYKAENTMQGGTVETKESLEVKFTEPPRIANRSDALELLDLLIKADDIQDDVYALQALKDAVEREII